MFPEGTRRKKGLRKKFDRSRNRCRADRDRRGRAARPRRGEGNRPARAAGPLRVAYGEPVPLDDLEEHDHGTAAKIATERLMERITELEEELRRG